ncbi:MAG: fimbrillin family protein [Rikenellaceae bacterium]|nr:fimbrillin family protein [Rikenellaceae bacterium]MBQ6571616.1 fimbrillin family protein [Alistipes sp.]
MNRIFTLLSALSLLLVSCEQFETPTINAPEGKVRVTIKSGSAQSRTSVAENGLSTTWCNDDQIAVWASNGSANVLNAQPFKVFYSQGNYTEFTTDITPMGDGTFTYYATHPLPATISGTTATFPIESVQQGSFDGTNDILVAYPASGLALENEDAEVSLTFKHKMHTLRMFVPDDVEGMGEPIRRIDITFPTQVVGDVSVDYTSAIAPATLANGSNTVSVEIPEGLSASSEAARKYAYAIVFPATMNESDQITFTVSTDNYRSVQSFGARSLSEGGSTPVRLTCSPDNRTLLRFKIKDNFLGENPTKVTFTAAIGEAVADCATTFDKFGYYDLDVTDLEGLAGQPITVTYESESAIVTQSLTLPNYEAGKLTNVDLTVPYLLYEDFSGMSAFENNTYEFGAFNYNPSAISLDSYGLAGWSGARIGGGANTNIRIACRYESGIGVAASYKGRCDSRPLSQIKEGKSVKLNVSYNYAADLHEEMGSGGSVTFWAGTTTTSGNIKGDVGITNVVLGESVLATDGPMAKGSWYGNTPHTQTYTVSGCGSTTRLSWRVGTNRGGSIAGRGYYWLYIDNVKVSIAK